MRSNVRSERFWAGVARRLLALEETGSVAPRSAIIPMVLGVVVRRSDGTLRRARHTDSHVDSVGAASVRFSVRGWQPCGFQERRVV